MSTVESAGAGPLANETTVVVGAGSIASCVVGGVLEQPTRIPNIQLAMKVRTITDFDAGLGGVIGFICISVVVSCKCVTKIRCVKDKVTEHTFTKHPGG